MTDWSEVTLDWGGSPPSHEIIATVRADIAANLGDLPRPSALAYHCVWLTSDYAGPSVVLWGVRGSDHFCAEYNEVTEMVSLSEIEDWAEDHGDPDYGDNDG